MGFQPMRARARCPCDEHGQDAHATNTGRMPVPRIVRVPGSQMSLIDDIASFSTTASLSRVQIAVAAKVLRISNEQGNTALQLIDAAMHNSQQAMQAVTADVGTCLDCTA